MATLTVTATEDYRDGTPPIDPNTTDILFATAGVTVATFGSDQFDPGPISNSVNITGDANFNFVAVVLSATGTFTAAGWQFTNWTPAETIALEGTSGDDNITGSSQRNTLTGGDGADTLTGGALADVFSYTASSHLVAGETIDGAGGNDRVTVSSGGSYDFSGFTLTSIEELGYSGGSGTTATLSGSQLGSGAIESVHDTSGGISALVVNGQTVDLSGVTTFQNWTNGTDTITINGTAAADSLTGSSQNDTIVGGFGADTQSGGDGDDIFVFVLNDFASGESVDGGAGTDTLQVNGGNHFLLGTIQSIEQITFGGPATFATASFAADQFGVGLIADNVAITGNAFTNEMQVDLSAPGTFSAAGWTFANWTDATDSVDIEGSSDADDITGSSRADRITGAGGADVLAGGGGDDTFTYVDTEHAVAGEQVDGGSETDTVRVIGTVDLTGVALTSIERLKLDGDATATLLGTQFGAGKITEVVGNSDPDSLIVNAASDVDLSGITFTSWTDGTDTITINGTAAAESLTGSNKNDTIDGGAGADIMAGGDGDDRFELAFGHFATGESIDGGTGDDALVINGSNAFFTGAIQSIESLAFEGFTLATADFFEDQFGSGLISDTVEIIGNGQSNRIIVQFPAAGTFSAAGWSFTSWTDGTDRISLTGSNGDDTITGSSRQDVFVGQGGMDNLAGGDGDDLFSYSGSGEAAAGEQVHGDGGTDTLEVASGVIDFTGVTLTGIERLSFRESGLFLSAGATLRATQIGAGFITEVVGSADTEALVVNAASDVDLTGVTFTSWTDGIDTITINGTAAGETLTGSNKNDIIVGGLGGDTTNGGDGDDLFRFTAASELSGEQIDGGNGTDTLELSDGSYQFWITATLAGVEALRFTGAGAAEAAFNSSDVGDGAITAITGSAGTNAITVNAGLFVGGGADLSALTFTSWTAGTDTITINGGTDADTLAGSSQNDLIKGGGGGDALNGGDGDDVFTYAAGEAVAGETVNGGNGSDTLGITGANDFSTGAVLTSIEALHFSTPGSATFRSTQIGAGQIAAITGSAGTNAIVVNAASDVDLSAVTFTSWTDGTDTITINGTADGETLTGSSQNDVINGGGGFDTAAFSGNRSSYTLQVVGSTIVIAGLDGTDTLGSIERLQFADGTVDLVNDGSALFDTPFYLSQNPDVFQFGIDALFHFNVVGFHEGRDPNAFFDTSGYLAANADVRASGVNPLDHYDQLGWLQGRDPSADFDTTLYLINNPDVAAAGVNPLAHFLQFGIAEGRSAFAAIGRNIVGGFDAEFYLFHNQDVAAAGVDPLFHYNVAGRFEGRNPNAWFDTAGYLSHYADVAAAGINPLQHYELVGWTEGRDPSATFDTLGYLAANPDVAAANINPLDHFLKFGIYEGRTAINDGVFF